MKGVSELKSRMQGIQDTVKITKAMYLLSASKMPRFDQRLAECRNWVALLEKAQGAVAHLKSLAPYYREASGTTGYLLFASDKGLCGDYNEKMRTLAMDVIPREGDRQVYAVGNMAKEMLKNMGIKCNNAFVHVMQSPMLSDAEQIVGTLLEAYDQGKLTQVQLLYTHSISRGVQETVVERLLPLERPQIEGERIPLSLGEQDGKGIIYNYLVGRVYLALIEAATALNFKRMTTMRQATDNANEILDEMTLKMNHLRQDGITMELSDVNTAKIANEERQ